MSKVSQGKGNTRHNKQNKRLKLLKQLTRPGTRSGDRHATAKKLVDNMWGTVGLLCFVAACCFLLAMAMAPEDSYFSTAKTSKPLHSAKTRTQTFADFVNRHLPLVPGAAAQCLVRPRLNKELPKEWDLAASAAFEYPRAGEARLEYQVCEVVTNSSAALSPVLRRVCAPQSWTAPLYWTCKFDDKEASGLTSSLSALFSPSAHGDSIVFDYATYQNLSWSEEIATAPGSGGGRDAAAVFLQRTCRLEPVFSQQYSILFEEWTRNNVLQARMLPEIYQQDYSNRSSIVRRFGTAMNASFPWYPCTSGQYSENELVVSFPEPKAFADWRPAPRPAAGGGGESGTQAAGAAAVTNSKGTRLLSRKGGLVSIDMMMKRETMRTLLYESAPHYQAASGRSATAAGMNADAGEPGQETASPEAAPSSDSSAPHNTTSILYRILNGDLLRGYCEDVIGLDEAELREVVETTYLPAGHKVGALEWVTLSQQDTNGVTLDADLCTQTWGRRFLSVYDETDETNQTFVFDAASAHPVIHNPWISDVPKTSQCLLSAFGFGLEWLSTSEAQQVVTVEHICLGYSRDHAHYEPKWSPVPLHGAGGVFTKCDQHGHLFHVWKGVTCSQEATSLVVTNVQDTLPPRLVVTPDKESGVTTQGLLTKDRLTYFAMKCYVPEQTDITSRVISGVHRDVVCLDNYIRETAREYFADNCISPLRIHVQALWENSTVMICPSPSASRDAHRQQLAKPVSTTESRQKMMENDAFPVLGCSLLTAQQIADRELAWIETNTDFPPTSSAAYFSKQNLCVNLRAMDTGKKETMIRIIVPVEAMDTCGNTARFAETPSLGGGERLAVSITLSDVNAYAGYLTKSKFCP